MYHIVNSVLSTLVKPSEITLIRLSRESWVVLAYSTRTKGAQIFLTAGVEHSVITANCVKNASEAQCELLSFCGRAEKS